MTSRRPPLTILLSLALFAAAVLFGFADVGAQPALIVAAVLLTGAAAGLYRGSAYVWVLVVAFGVANTIVALATGVAWWWVVAYHLVLLALLLAPPSMRHVRPDPSQPAKRGSRVSRLARFAGVVVAGMVLGWAAYLALLAPGPVSGDLEFVRGDRPGLRVLFIGTTVTSDHSMPQTVSRLGESDRGAPTIFVVRYARRGSRLADALEDRRLRELLDGERWDYVVLQEHGLTLSRPAERTAGTLRAAAALDGLARGAGARTVLFGNPGYEDGDDEKVPDDTYEAMQARMEEAQRELAARLSALPAPVGVAWEQARRALPDVDLWGDNGIRPSEPGSYLTACVLYAVLTRRDPTAASYDAGLDSGEARRLRQIAQQATRQTS